MNICGALDRCTPPEEAVQFHNALLENGVESVLVTYPQEGHGIREIPGGHRLCSPRRKLVCGAHAGGRRDDQQTCGYANEMTSW